MSHEEEPNAFETTSALSEEQELADFFKTPTVVTEITEADIAVTRNFSSFSGVGYLLAGYNNLLGEDIRAYSPTQGHTLLKEKVVAAGGRVKLDIGTSIIFPKWVPIVGGKKFDLHTLELGVYKDRLFLIGGMM